MCGRYYVDDETAREIEKLIWQERAMLSAADGRSGDSLDFRENR